MARTMLNDFNSPKYFLAEVINTSYYLQNNIYIRPILIKFLMNYGMVDNPTFLIFTLSDANLGSLILNLIREYSLDTQQHPKHIESITKRL
ncbi:hypothetical protein CR513_45565, partial [Mucuna pruriens]